MLSNTETPRLNHHFCTNEDRTAHATKPNQDLCILSNIDKQHKRDNKIIRFCTVMSNQPEYKQTFHFNVNDDMHLLKNVIRLLFVYVCCDGGYVNN